MKPDFTIHAELEELSPLLARASRSQPYSVPVGYFEQFTENLLLQIRAEKDPGAEIVALSPLLAGLPKKMPFTVPDSYFNSVPDDLKAGLSALEQTNELLETQHPLLEAARNSPAYRVPTGYFEDFPAEVLKKLPRPGKLVSFRTNWYRYAVAAALTGLLVLAAWMFNRPQPGINDTNAGLAQQIQQEIDQISDQAIMNYTDSSLSFLNGSTANNEEPLNSSDVHLLLQDVSDGALQQYLSEQPGKTIVPTN